MQESLEKGNLGSTDKIEREVLSNSGTSYCHKNFGVYV